MDRGIVGLSFSWVSIGGWKEEWRQSHKGNEKTDAKDGIAGHDK